MSTQVRRTRSSMPASNNEPDAASSSPQESRRVHNAIKKLHIDGNAALQGERVLPDVPTKTYRYRGSIYAVTDSTRPDWLDKQPARYQKRNSTGSPEVQKGGAKKTAAVKGGKRARTPEAPLERDTEEPASKRPRRHTENYNINYSRPKDLSEFTPGRRKSREARAAPAPTKAQERMKAMDFTRVGGHEDLSCIEHARRRAAQLGYSVTPISKKDLAYSTALEKTVTADVLSLARINTQIAKISNDLRRSEDLFEQYANSPHGRRRAIRMDGGEHEVMIRDGDDGQPPTFALSRQQVQRPLSPRSSPSMIRPRGTQEPTPPLNASHATAGHPSATGGEEEEESDVEIVTDQPHTAKRHDSGASLLHHHPSVSISLGAYKTTLPPAKLPATNKGGHKLRWSLNEHWDTVGRAEEAINKSRMTGESKSARRRRVKREMKIVMGWEVVKAEGAAVPEPKDEETVAGAEMAAHEDETGPAADEEDMREKECDDEEEAEIRIRTPTDVSKQFSPEASSNGSGERRSSRVEKHKTQVCRAWMRGTCVRGDRCTYSHAYGK